jgi:sulfoxide reductase heme-binding subunit YedZ
MSIFFGIPAALLALDAATASAATTLAHAASAASVASASTANPLLWYVTRAAAVSAYITLSITVVLGLVRSLARAARVRGGRALWLLDEAHPYLALLTAAFVALHLISLIFDPLIPFAPLNLLLPVGEPYRPFAVALGVLALYALGVVWLSSWLRRYIAYARWRTLHYTSFAAFALLTFHGILAGSDSTQPWMRLVYVAAAGVVGALVLARAFWPAPAPETRPARRPAA